MFSTCEISLIMIENDLDIKSVENEMKAAHDGTSLSLQHSGGIGSWISVSLSLA